MLRFAPAVFAVFALIAAATLDHPALAQSVHASLWVVSGDLPRNLGSADRVVRYARSHRARQLHESNEPEVDHRRWNATVVVQFARAFADRNFTLLFYDVTDDRALVGSPMDVYVRGQETVITQDVRMERPRFRPNRDLEIVLTVRRQEAGRARVRIVGQGPRGNGSLDFTQGDPDAPQTR